MNNSLYNQQPPRNPQPYWRVILADDEAPLRSALRLLLEQETGSSVVGEADHAERVYQQVQDQQPHILLLDWELPGLQETALIARLVDIAPTLHIIALSSRPEARHVALAAGAHGFVGKGDPPNYLLDALACFTKSNETVGVEGEYLG
jgi:DNA-binding NarL/FixJ family response regulator